MQEERPTSVPEEPAYDRLPLDEQPAAQQETAAPPEMYTEVPSAPETSRSTRGVARKLIQRIGPLALELHRVNIAKDFTPYEHKVNSLLQTEMSAAQIAEHLGVASAGLIHATQTRIFRKIRRTLPEGKYDSLIAKLRADIVKESSADSPEPRPDHPGLAIDRLRLKLANEGRQVRSQDLAAAMMNKIGRGDPRTVSHQAHALRQFLQGHQYWKPPRVAMLLEAMGIAEDQRDTLLREYNDIYDRRLKEIQAQIRMTRRKNDAAKAKPGGQPDGPAPQPSRETPMLAWTATKLSPFRKPLAEYERRPHQNERREYIKRIPPIALELGVVIKDCLTPREVKLCKLVVADESREEIKRALNFGNPDIVARAIVRIVDKIHFALPEDKRDQTTALLRAEIAKDLVHIPKQDPHHTGPEIDAFRRMMLERGRGSPAKIDELAKTLGIERNHLLEFFQGRRYIRPEQVTRILLQIGAIPDQRTQFIGKYNEARDAALKRRPFQAWDTRRKNEARPEAAKTKKARDYDPNHPGFAIDALRLALADEHKPGTIEDLARTARVRTDHLKAFLEGRRYLLPSQVICLLVEMGATSDEVIRHNASYAEAYAKRPKSHNIGD